MSNNVIEAIERLEDWAEDIEASAPVVDSAAVAREIRTLTARLRKAYRDDSAGEGGEKSCAKCGVRIAEPLLWPTEAERCAECGAPE